MFSKEVQAIKDKRKEFEAFITNKDIALAERWAAWAAAPSMAKNQETYIAHGLDQEIKELIGTDWCWYDTFGIEKYQTVELLYFVHEILLDHLASELTDEKYKELEDSFLLGDEKLIAIAEKVLKLNLESFIYDW